MKKFYTLFIMSAIFTGAFSADVAQWNGNDRNGVFPENDLLDSWHEGGPKMLWCNQEVGLGYSAVSVVDGKVFTQGTTQDKKREIFSVLDLSGKLLWSVDCGRAWSKSYENARTVPAIVGNFAYTSTGAGVVSCIDLKSQKLKWSVDTMEVYGGEPNTWGYGENILVEDGKVFFACGGTKTSVVALDSETGKLIWQTESLGKDATYTSPIIVDVGGKKQLIHCVQGFAFGVDIKDGKFLWKQVLKKIGKGGFPKHNSWEINAATPVFSNGKVFITAGYEFGAMLIEIPENSAAPKVVWESDVLDNHHGGVVLLDGKIYGATWKGNDKGTWACLDWESGKVIYDYEWQGHSKGSIVSAGGKLYIYEERKGDIALAKAGNSFEVISSFKVPEGSGKHWCHIVICNGIMYLRHGEALMAFDIKK